MSEKEKFYRALKWLIYVFLSFIAFGVILSVSTVFFL